MLDFRMDTFLAVCRHRNYTRAAEELNITQPAVTQHIQYLQSYYGVKLFSYQNKRLALTEEGELLRNAALCMLHDEEKLKRDVKDLRLGRRPIRFGATLTIGEYLLPERLAAYMKRNPRVDVHMLVENTQILLRMINDGELDFAVVEGYFRKSEYDYIIWSQEPYVCVCAAAHPLAQAAPRPLSALFGENLILRNQGSGSRDVLERVLEGRRMPAMDGRYLKAAEDNLYAELSIVKELVKADCGITFLYRKAVEKELAEGSLCQVALTDFQISHEFTFLWRKNSAFETELRETSRALWTL